MSQSQTIIDALVGMLETALPAYTVEDHFTQLEALDVENLPRAMVFDPAATRDRSDQGEITISIGVGIVLVREQQPDQVALMRTDVDTVETTIDATPRLTGDLVDFSLAAEWQVNETGQRLIVGSAIVDTSRVEP